jgi:hypothetical protein
MPYHFIDRANDLSQLGSGEGDFRRGIGTELVEAGQVREHNGVTGRETRKIGASLPQILDKGVLGRRGLLEWILDRMPPPGVKGVPAPTFDLDPAPLHLDNNQAVLRVQEDKVSLTIALVTVTDRLPSHGVENSPSI